LSHTLHRIAGLDGIQDDFVILLMSTRTCPPDGTTTAGYKECFEIMLRNNVVNMGGMGMGHLCTTTAEELLAKMDAIAPGLPMVHGVFSCREDLVNALREIKEADHGISVIVSGLVDATDCCTREAGVKRHSINYSLGIWGNTSKLPDERILQISSMCGHAMVSFNLIKKVVDDIKSGKTTAEKAAVELAKPCVCGIFNPARAQRLLKEFL